MFLKTHFFYHCLGLIACLCFSPLASAQTYAPRILNTSLALAPTAQDTNSKSLIFLASDLKNGGVSGVYRSFQLAARQLNWKVQLFDGEGSQSRLRMDFEQALRLRPDGIVLGGFQPEEFPDLLKAAHTQGVGLNGWHAAEDPGPQRYMFTNIATRALDVASLASSFVTGDGARPKGIVIINDQRFAVANRKTQKMRELLAQCPSCKILAIEHMPIAEAQGRIPGVVAALNEKFGREWTHTLAINDVYFDNMNFPLVYAGRRDIINIAAGDGSTKALSRIRSGFSQQQATVAEPLKAQGWQLVDEFRRAFLGLQPSGFVRHPILVTTAFMQQLGTADIEANLGYESFYLKIWGKSQELATTRLSKE